jgi:hypothetical protein
VCFNGPDSHVIVATGPNLEVVARQTFDGCVQGWAALE